MTNVMWLNSDKQGCGTYRCLVPAQGLQSRGYDNFFVEHKLIRTSTLSAEMDGIDVAVFQRAVGLIFLDWIRECHARDIATIFEMDDDLFAIPRHNPSHGFWGIKRVRRILLDTLAEVDLIIVSTVPLKQRLESLGVPSAKVHVCHNHINDDVWKHAAASPEMVDNKGLTVIGWQGSNTHDVDFREALPALRRVVDEHPNVMVRFFGGVPLTVRGMIPETRFQWTPGVEFDRYPAGLRYVNFDIGIAPITDSKFNQGKSNLKWMEYSALGIPTVASNVYPYARSIRHGETGFLAASEEEWYTALTSLLSDRAFRVAVGTAAQQEIRQRWSPGVHLPSWETALAAALTARRGTHALASQQREPTGV